MTVRIACVWRPLAGEPGAPLPAVPAEFTWQAGGLWLGSTGMPLAPAPNGVVVAAAARVDNFGALAARLALPLSSSTPALIAAAYDRWGDDVPAYLRGDFAFILWDAARRRLLCARDQMGVTPLFYALLPDGFAAASSVGALLPLVARRPDEVTISLFLGLGLEPGAERDRTFYHDIVRLPDAYRVTVAGDRPTATASAYWAFDAAAETRYRTDTDYAEAFRAVLEEAISVRRAGWRDEQVGAALSGGMDSSSVVCLLRADGAQAFHTFYMQPEAAAADESGYVDAVLARGGLRHHRAAVPGVFAGGMAIYDVLDMPTFWVNFPLSAAMYRLAAAVGVRAFFDGMDGDMIISYGRRWLTELLAAGDRPRFRAEAEAVGRARGQPARSVMRQYAFPHLGALAHTGRFGALARTVGALGADFGISAPALALDWARTFLAPEWFARGWQQWRRAGRFTAQRWRSANPLINPAFARRTDLEARFRAAERPPALTAREDHYRILTSGRLLTAFEDADTLGAAVGIVPLHPLSDLHVAEFCLGLPGDQRLRGGLSRWILRAALGDDLPPPIAGRADKTDFLPAVLHALRTHDLPFLDTVMATMLDRAAPYVNPPAVRAAYAQLRAGAPLSTPSMLALVRAARLAMWLEAKAIP